MKRRSRATLGAQLSPKTLQTVASAEPALSGAMILGSPDFMRSDPGERSIQQWIADDFLQTSRSPERRYRPAFCRWGGSRGPAVSSAPDDRKLIVILLRGAVDGLSVVVPYAEQNYYGVRSSISLPRPGQDGGVLDLDGRFGLHPALAPAYPYGSSARSHSSMPRARPIRRARISTLRTTWNRARPGVKRPRTAG